MKCQGTREIGLLYGGFIVSRFFSIHFKRPGWRILRSSRKNPYPPHGRLSEIPRGRGVLKAKILEAKYEAKLEFLRSKGGGGGGVQNEKPSMGGGGVWIFSGTAHCSVYQGLCYIEVH